MKNKIKYLKGEIKNCVIEHMRIKKQLKINQSLRDKNQSVSPIEVYNNELYKIWRNDLWSSVKVDNKYYYTDCSSLTAESLVQSRIGDMKG